jgi:hypothetical protein
MRSEINNQIKTFVCEKKEKILFHKTTKNMPKKAEVSE